MEDDANRALRSQRISDTYPARQRIFDQNTLVVRVYKRFTSAIVAAIVNFLFPRVLNNQSGIIGVLLRFVFSRTPMLKLLCDHQCEAGHVCKFDEGHSGPHICVFDHDCDKPIVQCGSTCDARGCDGECTLSPGHQGQHKCFFKHSWGDIPSSRSEQQMFNRDKAIGSYIDVLAYSSPEELKFAVIPETLHKRDENWTKV